jgi:small subunit ribosomal protein S2
MALSIDEIVDAQVHIGTLKSEAHPKTRQQWIDVIEGVVVFDPEKIQKQLEVAQKKVKKALDEKKDVLLVCEKKMYAEEVEKITQNKGVHFLNYKVPSGFLTNFDTFKKRVSSMNKMMSFLESGDFESLTKKEQLVYKRKLSKVQRVYKGIQNLPKRPDLVIIVDGEMMSSFVDEVQKQTDVDSIVISSSNFSRWWDADSLLLANIGAYKSIDFVLNTLLS